VGADDCNLVYNQLVATSSANIPTITVFLESFNSNDFPTGWTVSNQTANTEWIISNTSHAGGTANEAMLDWISGSETGNWTLTSPNINIAGHTNIQLNFNHYLWHFSSTYPYSIFIETSTDGGLWNSQLSVNNVSASIGPLTQNINLNSLSGTNLQIRFRMTGNPFGFYYWALDDVLLTSDGEPIPPQITWSPTTGLYTDATLTTPYTGGITDTVYAAPNGTETYTATDQNNCSETVTVSRNRKEWTGNISTNWYDNNNWLPVGIPTALSCVYIPDTSAGSGNYPTADVLNTTPFPPTTPAEALNLTLETNASLEVMSGSNLVVTDWMHLDGIINIRDSGSLIQINEGAANVNNNTGNGNINMQRTATIASSYDYIYWSSPVEGFNVTNVSPGSSHIYEWIPTINGNGTGNHGNWEATTET